MAALQNNLTIKSMNNAAQGIVAQNKWESNFGTLPMKIIADLPQYNAYLLAGPTVVPRKSACTGQATFYVYYF